VAEAIGTFLLVFTVGCNVLSGNAVWGGVSIGSVLMVAIYTFGGISGANFNPAVSLSLGITKMLQGPAGAGLPWRDVGIYAVVQVLAGVAASFGYATFFNNSFNVGPADGFTIVEASICEVLYTFMLCFVVLNVAATRKTGPNQYFGLAIGFVIVAGAYGAGAVSGGCFNPAVALGIQASAIGFGKGGVYNCLIYVACEMFGAILAALLYKIVRPQEFDQSKTMATDLVSEFLGTFMLVLTVGLNVLSKSPACAFSIAASLMCMIYALGDVSGANFNPAVSVALFLKQILPLDVAGAYIVAQLLGGISAAFTYTSIHGKQGSQWTGWFGSDSGASANHTAASGSADFQLHEGSFALEPGAGYDCFMLAVARRSSLSSCAMWYSPWLSPRPQSPRPCSAWPLVPVSPSVVMPLARCREAA